MNTEIKSIIARQIFDSRGFPTIETKVILENGVSGKASVPSGASTGKFEAIELRDNQKIYGGKSVLKAVENINYEISKLLKGVDVINQRKIDLMMIEADGTANKANFGANAILSVSLAAARAAANSLKIPLFYYLGGMKACELPVPFMNIINGGKHADNNLNIQEFMIAPTGAQTFEEAMMIGTDVYHSLKSVLRKRGLSTAIGDEGGFAPDLSSDEEALEAIMEAIDIAGYKPFDEVNIALDCAASEWFENGNYTFMKTNETFTPSSLSDYLLNLVNNYPIISIEDPFDQDDFQSFSDFTRSTDCQIVGDDLFVTNPERLLKGINCFAANSILIKPNQIGTLSETLDTIRIAQNEGYSVMVSHRSGETEDSFIADLSVAVGSGQIKTGAPCRGERLVKYNRLLMIEKMLSKNAIYKSLF